MTEQEKNQLELDYDALNINGKLEKLNITKKDYVNTTNEIRNMIIKFLLAQDVLDYYNEVKKEYTSKIKPIDRTNDAYYNHTCKKRNIFSRVLTKTFKRKS